MEYIYPKNIKQFITFIAKYSDSAVVSYTHSDVSGSSGELWVNDFSQMDIIRLFRKAGFRLTAQSLLTARDGTRMHAGGICLYYFEKLHTWHRRHDFMKRLRFWL
jgi:hypothetical protein